jgi:hypothetical protein
MSVKQMPAFAQVMPRVAAEYGKSLPGQLRDLMTYCLRGNKLSVDEYYAMCLFDDEAIPPEEKKRYVGLQKSRDIWGQFLEKNPWTGVIDDKLAYEKLLSGFGFKTAQTLAIVGGHYPADHPRRLATTDALAEFLTDARFPLFGKPFNSRQSLGSARFSGYDASSRVLTLSGNRAVSLDDLWTEIGTHFGGTYLFQELIEADPVLANICGGGLPTVRIVTLDSGGGPEIFRAAIKLTGKGNVADNFWREGNLLAPVDAEAGRMGAALTGMGIDGRFIDEHPDSGARIEGVELPQWQATRDAAIAAASVTHGALLIGFDIAVSAAGPVIIEANYDPHLIMMQACHRKGVLDGHMQTGLDHMKAVIAGQHADIKAHVLAERAQNKKDLAEALGRKVA